MPGKKPKRGRLHFLGITGHAMRGLADSARGLGYEVSGTDEGAYPPGTDWLDERGITWWRESDPEHLKGVDQVIISGHVQADHPELVAAEQQDITVRSFPELVADLVTDARRIVIAGTHGKTTTASLVAWILESAGRNPDYLIGIKPHNFDSSVRLTGSDVAVIEGDEYRASQLDTKSKFAYYKPDVLVVTSVEMDHPDFFKDLGDISARFETLVRDLPSGGQYVYWQGSEVAVRLAAGSPAPAEAYDYSDAAWNATDLSFEPDGIHFTAVHDGENLGDVRVPLYGRHNALNALAAIAVTKGEGVSFKDLQEALQGFKGASRRFDVVSDGPVRVLDDYAHHPTEVATTIEAAKLHFAGRVIAVFRPHTFSRTKTLLKEYQSAFKDADQAFVADIEGAREAHLAATVSGEDIAKGAGELVAYVPQRSELLESVARAAQRGDTVLCMSVNGHDGFAAELAERLR